ncbi:type I-E CRISPR-associated protein Cse2/CasB [Streptomyces sp. NPDC020965]|uniref:type I-E CRISPR-associated protein Cse2/CasB n=1 Tax=Streptomyces sp. NPDC020965 TaxID=3365105 RepID=UPI0037AFAAF3
MPTAAGHHAGYDEFVDMIHELCRQPGIRKKLSTGRGRPIEECALMHSYLRRTIRRPGRRAFYTTASLIALADPTCHDADDPGPHAPTPGPVPTVGTASAAPPDSTGPVAVQPWFSRPNLGATLATAVRNAGYSEQRTGDRLHVLNRLGDDQLHRRLPQDVTRLLRSGLTPDWAVLLNDLIQRSYHRDKVALRWSDSFYLALEDEPAA